MADEFRRERPCGSSSKPATVVVDIYDDPIDDEDSLEIYKWLDTVAFSKSRKTSANRDFSDGVMMAELIAHYIPKLIINPMYYIPTSASTKKINNWEHLNDKVFKRIGFQLTPDIIKELAASRPGMIEMVLKALQPILLKGPKAILPFSKKLENVKPRFMDFQKSYLKRKPGRPKASEMPIPTHTSRPQSAVHSRHRTPTRYRSFNTPGAPPPSAVPEPPEVEVLKTPCPRSSSRRHRRRSNSCKKHESMSPLSETNYDILTRPSTGKSSNRAPSPTDLLTGVKNLKEQLDQQENGDNSGAVVLSNKRGFPTRSGWIPVEGEEGIFEIVNDTTNIPTDSEDGDRGVSRKANTENQISTRSNNNNEEEEADEEIYCEQSGYDEDTENDDASDGDGETGEDDNSFFSYSGNRSTTTTRKRRLKRVVKYEYREEYILNGLASLQVPNTTQLDKMRKNFMSPGNNDPNCRGYGFV